MTSREVVNKTLAFEGSARVAVSFEPSDLIEAAPEIPNPEGEWRKINDREWRRVDEWGNLWGRIDQTSKGEVIQGALNNWLRMWKLCKDLNPRETTKFG